MTTAEARQLVQKTFQNPFDKGQFIYFIKNLVNEIDEEKAFHARGYVHEKYRDRVKTYERIGTYTDPENNKIDILIVYLQKESSIDRARTTLRNFVGDYLKERGEKEAGLIAFVSPNEKDWRFSLVKMEYKITETPSGRIKAKEEFTPAKRYSFLVGVEETSHTAQSRLVPILEDDKQNPTLKQIEEAFNIEKVTKEFFEKYRNLYLQVKEILDEVLKNDKAIKADFAGKNIGTVDFGKTLLGQIVFLYFLQKKGWFGVKRGEAWGSGSKNFLRELFDKKHGDYKNFFNDILEPLFYEALRNDRSHDDHYFSMFKCKIPFLNGGLFDPINNYDWKETDIILPNDLFSNTYKTKEGDIGTGTLDIFDRYNFTVKEDEPLEKEVAVDPEMLGKVFENLLEVKDRKSKGTYYTPREIVHYMCQESLVNYLATELDKKVSKKDIETLIKYGETVVEHEAEVESRGKETKTYSHKLSKAVRDNAKLIDEKLETIRICDPAVGSGAFPVGMMNEIIRTRNALTSYLPAPRRYFVYAILCDNDSVYIGQTDNLTKRWEEHRSGKASWTAKFKPVEIIHYEGFETRGEAVKREKWLKTGFGRKWLKRNQKSGRLQKWDKEAARQAGLKIKKGRTIYDFKRHAIQNCLYGVDIDLGAVEIAKLRLWLSLIVDEEDVKQIKPLPNLDYKIVQGNSLSSVEKSGLFISHWMQELEKIKALLFDETNARKKQEYQKQIDELINQITNNSRDFDFEIYFSEIFHEKGGFDVVIANPPYEEISGKSGKEIYQKYYSSVLSGHYDLYIFFFKRAFDIANNNGVISFITSHTYIHYPQFVNLRKYIFENGHILEITNRISGIFESAVVDNALILIQKDNIEDNQTTVFSSKKEELNKLVNEEAIILKRSEFNFSNFDLNAIKNRKVLSKFIKDTKPLGDITESSQGITVYAKVQGAKKDWFRDEEVDKNSKPVIRGRDIFLYGLRWADRYIQYGDWLWCPRNKKFFENEKLFFRQTADRLIGTYEHRPIYCIDSVHSIINQSNNGLNLKYILAILNSKFGNFLYNLLISEVGKVFAQVKLTFLRQIPIKIASQKDQKPLIELVDKVLVITKDSDYLENNTKQAKVRDYEKQIDQLVYKLYGLTPEEIKVVEENRNG